MRLSHSSRSLVIYTPFRLLSKVASENRTGRSGPHARSSTAAKAMSSGFVGFSHGRFALSAKRPSTEASAALVYTGDDQAITALVKRLAKKDAVTRRRALQSLCSLVETRQAVVAEILPAFLFHLSGKYVLDNNSQVRSAASTAIRALVQADRQAVARGLPRLLGPWLLLAADPAPEVRTVALKALQDAFGQELPRALERYSLQILRALSLQLRVEPERVGESDDKDAGDKEPVSETYIRMNLALMRALKLLLSTLGRGACLRILQGRDRKTHV